MPSASARLPELTGLRALAAGSVLVFHAYALYKFQGGPWAAGSHQFGLQWGWLGVDLFFVLSGFLLSMPLLRRPDQIRKPGFWRAYMTRRWWRIAPPYYLSIPVALIAFNNLAYVRDHAVDVVAHVFYLHSFTFESYTAINPVYWTLANEFQFYVMLPLLVLLFVRRSWAWAALGLSLASVAWRVGAYQAGPGWIWLSFTVLGFLPHFALGIAAARLYVRGWKPPARPEILAPLVLALFVLAPLLLLNPAGSWRQGDESLWANALLRPLVAVGFAGLVLLSAATDSWLRRALSVRPLQGLGEVSYSVYLVHTPLLVAVQGVAPLFQHGFAVYLALVLPYCLAGSAVFYFVVERPSLRFRDWLADRPRRERAPDPGPAVPIGEPAPQPVASA